MKQLGFSEDAILKMNLLGLTVLSDYEETQDIFCINNDDDIQLAVYDSGENWTPGDIQKVMNTHLCTRVLELYIEGTTTLLPYTEDNFIRLLQELMEHVKNN